MDFEKALFGVGGGKERDSFTLKHRTCNPAILVVGVSACSFVVKRHRGDFENWALKLGNVTATMSAWSSVV